MEVSRQAAATAVMGYISDTIIVTIIRANVPTVESDHSSTHCVGVMTVSYNNSYTTTTTTTSKSPQCFIHFIRLGYYEGNDNEQ